jgi:hypothetical protein
MKIKPTFRLVLTILLITGLEIQMVQATVHTAPQLPEALLRVDTTLDSNAAAYQTCSDMTAEDCSLRGAISRANAEPGVMFTILLPPGTYHLSLPGEEDDNQVGDLDVFGQVVIDRESAGEVILSGGALDRVFQFFPNAHGEIKNLTITNGQAGLDQSGGGIHNAGLLILSSVTVTANRAGDGRMAVQSEMAGKPGGSGGGIENLGELTLQNCTISDNQAGTGGDTLPEFYGYLQQTGGTGGAGGGIANRGSLELINSVINDNQAGAGGAGRSTYIPHWQGSFDNAVPGMNDSPTGSDYAGHGGKGGTGGGIFNGGQLSIVDSEVKSNLAGVGGAGGIAFQMGGWGGQGGYGGGISSNGWLQATNTVIMENQSGLSGASGVGEYKQGESGSRGPGYGGGLYNAYAAELVDCQVEANVTAPEIQGRDNYFFAHGGGIYNDRSGNLSLLDTQVIENQAAGEGGGILNLGELTLVGGQLDRNQARGLGGGINNDGRFRGSAFSLSGNLSGPGYEGYQYFGGGVGGLLAPTDGFTPGGGGLYNSGEAWLVEVHIDQNTAGNGGKGSDNRSGHPYQGGDGGSGGYGGGLYNQGRLEIYLATLQNNQTGQGGMGGSSDDGNGLNGVGGPGGAIFNGGELTAAYLTIQGNQTGLGATEAEDGGHGGGLDNTGSLSLHDSQVTGNQTAMGGMGGGIAILGCSGGTFEPMIANTTIRGNHARAHGGGVYLAGCNAHLDNLVLADNQVEADHQGSGLYQTGIQTILRHLTIANNSGGDGSGAYLQTGIAAFTNTIVAGQTVGVYLAQGTQAKMDSTLWGAGDWANSLDWSGPGTMDPGSQNISGDPLFLDPAQGDYHVAADSPAVNAGQLTDLNFDLDNQPRPAAGNSLPAIGADESWSLIPLSGLSLIVPPEVNDSNPAEFRVEITPLDATLYVRYLWSPPPQSGQWTSQATYIFEHGGEQAITVWAIQAGRVLSLTAIVPVQATTRFLYLPQVIR